MNPFLITFLGVIIGIGLAFVIVMMVMRGKARFSLRGKPVFAIVIALVVIIGGIVLFANGREWFAAVMAWLPTFPSWVMWVALAVAVLIVVMIISRGKGGGSSATLLAGDSNKALKYSFIVLGVLIAAIVVLNIFTPEFVKAAASSPLLMSAVVIGVIAFIIAIFMQVKNNDGGVTTLLISLGVAALAILLTFGFLNKREAGVACSKKVQMVTYGTTFKVSAKCPLIIAHEGIARRDLYFDLTDGALRSGTPDRLFVRFDRSYRGRNVSDSRLIPDRDSYEAYGVEELEFVAYRRGDAPPPPRNVASAGGTSALDALARGDSATEPQGSEAKGLDYLNPGTKKPAS